MRVLSRSSPYGKIARDDVAFKLTDKQLLLRTAAASDANHVLAYGGGRSGKTFGFCYFIGVRALSTPGSRHLIGRLHNIDVRQAVMLDTWPKMMRAAFPGLPYDLNKSDQYVTMGDDAQVWFAGFDDKERIEKILGKEYATIYPNECSQVPYETILMLRTRLAQNVQKSNGIDLVPKMYYDLNPVGRSHWTHKEFVLGVRPDNGISMPAGSRAWVQLNPADNPHLPASYLTELDNLPERQRQRFRDGNYQSEVPGALWPMETVDASRWARPGDGGEEALVAWAQERCSRIVVALDPSGSDGVGGDSQGIIVAGLLADADDEAVVLEDATCRLSPAGWGDRAVQKYHKWKADKIIAEGNFGGAMVKHTISTVDDKVPVKIVTASRGKHIRAEPVSALYEDRPEHPAKVHHVGYFPELEDQMAAFNTQGYQGSGSPDRADALVWAMSELILEPRTPDYPWFVG
jgi:phage terminase large subunit-like protein